MLMFLPPEFVWKKEVALEDGLKLKIPSVQRAIRMDSSHNFAKAKRLWKEGDIYVAKKNLVHGIRYLLYGLQLIEHNRVTDFHAGNDCWVEIMSNTSLNWIDYEKKYLPIYDDLTAKLKADQIGELRLDSSEDTLDVVKYLRANGLDALVSKFSVKVFRSAEFPSLVHISHDSSTPLNFTITQECTGVILEEKENWAVVAMPFKKVFSTTSDLSVIPKINPTYATCYDLLDGKMACLYHFQGQWLVSSKETSDGSELVGKVDVLRTADWTSFVTLATPKINPVHAKPQLVNGGQSSPSFKALFWEIWKAGAYQLPTDTAKCFIFELLTPLETNVIEHSKSKLILIGVRDLKTHLEEAPEEFAKQFAWECVPGFDSPSLDAVNAKSFELDVMLKAGFVVCDEHFTRLMIRSPQFHSLEKLNPLNDAPHNLKLMLDIVRTNSHKTWLECPRYSHWAPLYNHVSTVFEEAIAVIQKHYDKVRVGWNPAERGKHAAAAKKTAFAPIIFDLMTEDCKIDLRFLFARLPLRRVQATFKAMFEAKQITHSL